MDSILSIKHSELFEYTKYIDHSIYHDISNSWLNTIIRKWEAYMRSQK